MPRNGISPPNTFGCINKIDRGTPRDPFWNVQAALRWRSAWLSRGNPVRKPGLSGRRPIRRDLGLCFNPQRYHLPVITRIARYEGDVIRPGFKRPTLLVLILVPIIGPGQRAFRMIEHAIYRVLGYVQRGHAGAYGAPQIMQPPTGHAG